MGARKVLIDGVGNAGTAVARELASLCASAGVYPSLELCDSGQWLPHHAEAGLVDRACVGQPKAAAFARQMASAGWPVARLKAHADDVRSRPRGAYRDGITLAATDSHACKYSTVLKSQQAGSPSLAIGLGRAATAVLECFAAGGCYGYCCVHGADPGWSRRQPCEPPLPVSATAIARQSPQTVRRAAQLAATIVLACLRTGGFPGGTGFHLHEGRVESFSFGASAECVGPHDRPYGPGHGGVISIAGRPNELSLRELLDRAGGATACYADREVAWRWWCERCGGWVQRVHVVYPAAHCAGCGMEMRAGLERVSGLTAAELERLQGAALTLAAMGLGGETLLRCFAPDGGVVWLQWEEHS